MEINKTKIKAGASLTAAIVTLWCLGVLLVFIFAFFADYVVGKLPDHPNPYYEPSTKSDYAPLGGYVGE